MFGFVLGLIGVLISLIGWFAFDSLLLLIIGTVCYVIESLLEWRELNAGAKFFDIFIFGIGCLIALFVKTPIYIGGLIAINCYSALMCVIGLPGFISQVSLCFKFFRR